MSRVDTKTEFQLSNALEHLEITRRELEVLPKAGFKAPGNQPDLESKLLRVKTILREAQIELHRLLLNEKTYLNSRPQSEVRLYRTGQRRFVLTGKCGGCGGRR